MKYILPFLLLNLSFYLACAQAPVDRPHLANPKFDKQVTRLIDFSVPVISVEELNQHREDYVILDTRERAEYDVSHIPGAIYLGYDQLHTKVLNDIPKDAKIVTYCSVGYRSEKIGEYLQENGFSNVHNLFGSIFEWINQGYTVVNTNGETVEKVHTYNKKWSKWVEEGKAVKVW